ncbi:MOSC domain-containing protein [Gluconacetobacter tumulisoli]|uniref:MOSC domain-containing protein n=1 Tax=Gluconacetobacter tumulisoli TaxID=1286189 RepID=A0A7W4PMD8_9PROT|nr:MOSC domain-containing protein [Gluconacetobacter tumulisoli]MBB2201534.1 MOSC domain-containing protein [Gluconacetobacter tumulisoli]
MTGRVCGIYTAEVAAQEMMEGHECRLLANVGIEGDRYARRIGRWSDRPKTEHQISFIELEVLHQIYDETGVVLTPRETRRNIITCGVRLNDFLGQTIRVGKNALVYVEKLNHPCKYLERLIDKQVMASLLGRSGLNCQVISGGIVRLGDRIERVL